MVSHEALIILQQATKRTHPRKSPLVSEISIYIYLYYVYYNSTNLSMWVVYTTCVSKNSILNYVIFYLEYNVIRWSSHICKKLLFSHSIVSKRSLVNNTGEVLEWNWQSVPNLNGWKIPLSSDILFKWSHVSFVIFFILFYIERKWLLMRNLATILPLKFKLSGKFQSYG